MKPTGFFVDDQAWEKAPLKRAGFYTENPPDSWEECGCCGGYHPSNYAGDCRSDINRWPSETAISAMEGSR